MVAAFHHVAVPEDQNQVCVANGAEPVGNDEGGAVFRQPVHGLLNQGFGPGIHRGGGLIQDEQRRVLNHGPGDGHQLLLTGGEVGAVVERGVIALRQRPDEVVQSHGFTGSLNLCIADALLGVDNVFPDGALEEPGVLENHAKQVMDVFPGEVGNVLAVDANFATVQLVEPHEQVHQSRLACAGGTYNGHLLARLGMGREVLDDGFVGCVAKADMGEFHIAPHLLHRQNLGFSGLIRQLLLLQEVKDPLGGGGGGLEAGGRLGNLGQGIGELPHIDHEGNDGTEVCVASLDQHSAHHTHRHIAQIAYKGHEGLHETGEELRFPSTVVEVLIDLVEGVLSCLLAVIGLDHVVTGVNFLNVSVELAQILLLADEVLLGFADDQYHEAKAQDGGDNGGQGHDAVGEEHHEQRA